MPPLTTGGGGIVFRSSSVVRPSVVH